MLATARAAFNWRNTGLLICCNLYKQRYTFHSHTINPIAGTKSTLFGHSNYLWCINLTTCSTWNWISTLKLMTCIICVNMHSKLSCSLGMPVFFSSTSWAFIIFSAIPCGCVFSSLSSPVHSLSRMTSHARRTRLKSLSFPDFTYSWAYKISKCRVNAKWAKKGSIIFMVSLIHITIHTCVYWLVRTTLARIREQKNNKLAY